MFIKQNIFTSVRPAGSTLGVNSVAKIKMFKENNKTNFIFSVCSVPSVVRTKGFTLLEVLVVFVIMALILAIVPPFLPNVIASTHVKSAARELAANLKHARSQAIDHQKETTLIINIDKNNYVLNEKLKNLTLPDEASLSLITAKSEQLSENEGQIRFFPDGSSTGGQIKLTYNNNEYRVDVHWLTGKVVIGP